MPGRRYPFHIRKLAREIDPVNADVSKVFLCEAMPDGRGCRVFACASCRNQSTYDPQRRDLFDGHTVPRGVAPQNLGLDEHPAALAGLDVHDRNSLGLLKVSDGTFRGYAGKEYAASSGGAMFQPGDFAGAAALLVSNGRPEGVDAARAARRRRALVYLSGRNPAVQTWLTMGERAETAARNADVDDAFPDDAGGASTFAFPSFDDLRAHGSTTPAAGEDRVVVRAPGADVRLAPYNDAKSVGTLLPGREYRFPPPRGHFRPIRGFTRRAVAFDRDAAGRRKPRRRPR